mmetsp:Transcript_39/g.75  ORF Transcript_39/g.75 Transcript_39/m.75 type:complete len:114 (-) Transcript_39:48-389(-)
MHHFLQVMPDDGLEDRGVQVQQRRDGSRLQVDTDFGLLCPCLMKPSDMGGDEHSTACQSPLCQTYTTAVMIAFSKKSQSPHHANSALARACYPTIAGQLLSLPVTRHSGEFKG